MDKMGVDMLKLTGLIEPNFTPKRHLMKEKITQVLLGVNLVIR